jgi:hypothetical protein
MSYSDYDCIEIPVVAKFNSNGQPILVVYSHINEKGRMILNKEEAMLLIAELYNFVKDKDSL